MYYFKPKKYLKNQPRDSFNSQVNLSFATKTKGIPTLIMTIGVLTIVTQILLPLVFFTTSNEVASPVASSVLGYATGFNAFEFTELNNDSSILEKPNVPTNFYLTVPKIGIKDATVHSNSTDMSPEGFIGHYKGSALPGEVGNVFLYGHSVLQMFYNPRNYQTIFSTLDKLTVGDSFTINYNNKSYIYEVFESRALRIDEVKPLATIRPAYLNESTITLMTCWPPGLKSKRFVVKASLVN